MKGKDQLKVQQNSVMIGRDQIKVQQKSAIQQLSVMLIIICMFGVKIQNVGFRV